MISRQVIGRGSHAEFSPSPGGLIVPLHELRQPRRATEQDHQQPARERIQGPGVPDRLHAQRAPDRITTSCEVGPTGLSTSSAPDFRPGPRA
jgi:hypothetical protein